MKKTLITLAALAVASVASAATLDFNTAIDGSIVTFGGTSDDVITLVGATTLNGNTMSYGDVAVTVNGPLFNDKSGNTGTLKGATINLGTAGSLAVTGDVNFGVDGNAQNLTFTLTLPDLIIETDDASLDGKLVYTSRSIFTANSGNYNIWNWERATITATTADGTATTFAGNSVYDGSAGMDKVGGYTVWSGDKDGKAYIDVRYVSQYKYVAAETPAVPEPTTATLSLLALAGLAARRRRK